MMEQMEYKEQAEEQVLQLNKYLIKYLSATLAIAAGELVFAFHPLWGTVVLFACFWALAGASYQTSRPSGRKIYLSFTLIPLMRIFSVSMPISHLPLTFWYLIISLPLFLSLLMTVKAMGLTPKEIGLTAEKPHLQLLIILLGIPLGWVGSQLSLEIPAGSLFESQPFWLSAIVLIICTGFLEELVFRGIIYRALLEELGRKQSGVLVSLCHSSLYLSSLSPVQVSYVFVVGIIFTLIYDRQKSIVGIAAAHGLLNIILLLIRPAAF